MMGGYLPLDWKSEDGKKLLQLVDELNLLVLKWKNFVKKEDDTDDVFYDTIFLCKLDVAKKLIQEVVTEIGQVKI